MKVYKAGITYNVKTSDSIKPPTILKPIGILLVEESPIAKAIGNAP